MKAKFLLLIIFFFLVISCKEDNKVDTSNLDEKTNVSINHKTVDLFLKSYPELRKYNKQLKNLYDEKQNEAIWHSNEELQELASVLHYNLHNASNESNISKIPYLDNFDSIFSSEEIKLSIVNRDILISGLYLYYADHFYDGTDYNTSRLGWYLPRKKIDYLELIDSIIENPNADVNKIVEIDQYYKLSEHLKRFRAIEKKGGWKKIEATTKDFPIKFGDSSKVVSQIKSRLFESGKFKNNNSSNFFDEPLKFALLQFQKENNLEQNDTIITKNLVDALNVPVSEKIKKLVVNLERCRWIDPKLFNAEEYIMVNIPSYELNYYKKKGIAFHTNVVVGKKASKTVIFSGNMSYIVFSPYWNLPQSIINNEVIPGMKKDKNYLANHNMEWNNGNVRQLPGKNNSLGLVKFMFPNANNIYLHDTPSKSLFSKDERAFSHGCIRVENPKGLAEEILENYPRWTSKKIDDAMNKGSEKSFTLQHKIPVVIGYFTAWVNDDDELIFYEDIYNRDNRLAKILYRD